MASGWNGIFLLVLTLLAGSASAADLNMAGQGDLLVGTVVFEDTVWAEIRMSSGGYIPDGNTAFGAEATVVKHAAFRVTPEEAGQLAEGLFAWRRAPHNDSVFRVDDGAIGLSFIGQDGVTWNPSYQPIVVAATQEWAAVGSRGRIHGGIYVALSKAQSLGLAQALAAWSLNPVPSDVLLYQAHAQ